MIAIANGNRNGCWSRLYPPWCWKPIERNIGNLGRASPEWNGADVGGGLAGIDRGAPSGPVSYRGVEAVATKPGSMRARSRQVQMVSWLGLANCVPVSLSPADASPSMEYTAAR